MVDGTPSPLKSQARIGRFFQASGLDLSSLPVPEDGVLVERNQAFTKCVKECVVSFSFESLTSYLAEFVAKQHP